MREKEREYVQESVCCVCVCVRVYTWLQLSNLMIGCMYAYRTMELAFEKHFLKEPYTRDLYSAKETHIWKEPTNHSHSIAS